MSSRLFLIPQAILIFYFLYKTKRSKQPIYLLGIPFLQFMGRAFFFDKEEWYWTNFTGLDGIWAIFISLFIVWFLNIIWRLRIANELQHPFTLFGRLKPFTGEIPIILLFSLWLINLGINTVRFSNISNLLSASIEAGSIFFGYMLMRGIVANTDLDVLIEFIKSLCLITAVSAILFFLHQGLNINIYAGSGSDDLNETAFGSASVRRSTYYFPPLTYLAFCFGLIPTIKREKIIIVTWLLALLAYVFSYTRTYILGSLFLIFCSYLLISLRFRSAKYVAKLLNVIARLGVGGLFCYLILPVQSGYMIERLFEGFSSLGNQESTLSYRWLWITNTWEMIKPNFLLGIGSPGTMNFPNQFWTDRWVWDSWTVMVMQYWGIIGIAIILWLFYAGLKQAYAFFRSTEPNLQFLGLLFFLVITAVFFEGIFGPIFMENLRYPMGFWYFAFLYGIASKLGMEKVMSQR